MKDAENKGESETEGTIRHAVGGMVQKPRKTRDVIIVQQTSEQFESALRRYKQAADKSWSLTDCASFQVMEAEQIQAALTHDRTSFMFLSFLAHISPNRSTSFTTASLGVLLYMWSRVKDEQKAGQLPISPRANDE